MMKLQATRSWEMKASATGPVSQDSLVDDPFGNKVSRLCVPAQLEESRMVGQQGEGATAGLEAPRPAPSIGLDPLIRAGKTDIVVSDAIVDRST
jgi:hypothetical protein